MPTQPPLFPDMPTLTRRSGTPTTPPAQLPGFNAPDLFASRARTFDTSSASSASLELSHPDETPDQRRVRQAADATKPMF